MTQKEIIEGNKIIAEYNGYYVKDNSDTTSDERFGGGVRYLFIKDGITTSDVFYDSSWDWLMPVVEKIRKTAHCVIDSDTDDKKDAYMLFSLGIVTPIETVWLFVLKYIKWYNTQKH